MSHLCDLTDMDGGPIEIHELHIKKSVVDEMLNNCFIGVPLDDIPCNSIDFVMIGDESFNDHWTNRGKTFHAKKIEPKSM